MEQEREEGEMSDDNDMLVDDEETHTVDNNISSTLFYKADKNGLIVEELKKVDAFKLEERAKRFGLNLSGNKVITQHQIDELYNNFGIQSGNERHFRLDTLHLNGVNGLTTKEIFEYLEDYKPVSLEWIDDNSCNIVCHDHISAALALLVHSREINNEEIQKMLLDKSSYHWREAMPHPKGDTILMRFATNSDKKIAIKKPDRKLKDTCDMETMSNPTKNPWGDLCKSWGVYDHQEIFQRKFPKTNFGDEPIEPIKLKNKKLAMRLGKRNHKVEDDEDGSSSDSEWKKRSKIPRMRMHADDEESKQVKQKTLYQYDDDESKSSFAPLSIEVVNSKSTFVPRETKIVSDKFKYKENKTSHTSKNIQSRLGVKVVRDQSNSSDEYSSDETDQYTMSRVQKVKNNAKSSVWSRLEGNVAKNTNQNDLRQILTRTNKSDDLREKLSKSKQCNLRIEIDNNYTDDE